MIQDLILKLIIFFIPTQLGLHFWPEFSRVGGIRVDYYSPTFYLTDLLIFIYLFLNANFLLSKFKQNHKKVLVLFVLVSLNFLSSINRLNTLFQLVRLAEYFSLFLVLNRQSNLWKKIATPFQSSLVLVIVLQLAQQLLQRSINGPFYFVGERFFTGSTPNLPQLIINNTSFVRASSIFPHPNALAGFLCLSLLVLTKYGSPLYLKFLNIVSLVTTFSKSAYLAILSTMFKISLGSKTYLVFILISLAQLFIPVLHTGIYSLDSRSLMLRSYKEIIPKYYLQGAGFGNYPTALSETLPGSMYTISSLQPIHNLFLLLVAELGLPTTLLLTFYLVKKYQNKYLKIILIILVSGLFDHYWLTIPQNKLILILSLALFK